MKKMYRLKELVSGSPNLATNLFKAKREKWADREEEKEPEASKFLPLFCSSFLVLSKVYFFKTELNAQERELRERSKLHETVISTIKQGLN